LVRTGRVRHDCRGRFPTASKIRPPEPGYLVKSHLLALLLAALSPAIALAAGQDNNVEWAGLSHVAWQDRRPLCPVANEAFTVRFQTWTNDLTSARVSVTDGGAPFWVNAAKIGTRGPYDIWEASIPATATSTPSYWIELSDGTDSDYLSVGGVSDGTPVDGGWGLNFTNYSHAPIGATPVSGGGAVFKVWAPASTGANVRGSFSGWGAGTPLTKVGEYFSGRVASGVPVLSQYKFYFNNSVWNTDPRARGLDASNGPYNAILQNPFGYVWQHDDFVTPPHDQLVVYQLHTGTFAGRNDPVPGAAFPTRYQDVAARVSHLAELGVNAVMLNPITEFPGDESAGYNPITAFSPEWKYGTPDQFKAMVDSLHGRGIAVLLDIVWNHLSPTDNFLWNYDGSQQWFDSPTAVDTPWGSQADFDKLAVRDYYANSALQWLEEYRLDGFRMDATDYMNLAAQAANGWALMQRMNDEMDNRWADKFAVAEQLPNDDYVTRPTSLGGAGFDAQYHDAFTDNLRQEILDAALGDPEMSKIRNIILGSGTYISGSKAFNYFELHDEAWPSSGGQRMAKTIDTTAPHNDLYARGRTKLAQGLLMFAPGVPAFLMGDEWLEDTDFGANFGNRIDWSKKTTYADYFAYFKKVIELRRTIEAFRAGQFVHVFHVNEGGNVLAFRRTDSQGTPFVVIANFSNTNYPAYRIGAPQTGNWVERVNSQSSAYGGNGQDNPGQIATDAISSDGFSQSIAISVPQMALIVLAPYSTVGVEGAGTRGGVRFTRVSPLPARHGTTFEFTLPSDGDVRLEIFDVGGRRIATPHSGPMAAGAHAIRWDGADANRRAAGSGLYFAKLMQGGASDTRRVPVLE
jgi:1,4-alpha-glucan branching enzyme